LPAHVTFILVALRYPELPREFLYGWIPLHELRGPHGERRKRGKPRLGYCVMDSFRVKLLIEVFLDPGFLNPLNVAWPPTVADPIEQVGNRILHDCVDSLRGDSV